MHLELARHLQKELLLQMAILVMMMKTITNFFHNRGIFYCTNKSEFGNSQLYRVDNIPLAAASHVESEDEHNHESSESESDSDSDSDSGSGSGSNSESEGESNTESDIESNNESNVASESDQETSSPSFFGSISNLFAGTSPEESNRKVKGKKKKEEPITENNISSTLPLNQHKTSRVRIQLKAIFGKSTPLCISQSSQ